MVVMDRTSARSPRYPSASSSARALEKRHDEERVGYHQPLSNDDGDCFGETMLMLYYPRATWLRLTDNGITTRHTGRCSLYKTDDAPDRGRTWPRQRSALLFSPAHRERRPGRLRRQEREVNMVLDTRSFSEDHRSLLTWPTRLGHAYRRRVRYHRHELRALDTQEAEAALEDNRIDNDEEGARQR
ncbi:hypothetical protein BD626DRAFT_542072 [Schizophyllum amplum]|uniref:Uncharacterized protein n=1 Tax=Schizophyllum amplum TaxID=97359 RepID=A0A550BSX0_9AGAR|nr:hypothetical protein BD626DRAFT_542072 [Auriculariopsis ampla]